MARTARAVAVGVPHHVTQRGNYQQDVFFDRADRLAYMGILRKQKVKYGLKICSYSLMTNHIHLVAIPLRKNSLAKAVGLTHLKYARYLNQKMKRMGHLWQNRYYSCPLDEAHAEAAVRYAEQNAVRAGMAAKPWDYEWSSARAHVTGEDPHRLLDDAGPKKKDWKATLSAPLNEAELALLRKGTKCGRPVGAIPFIKELQKKMKRPFLGRPVGRPPRRKTAKKTPPEFPRKTGG